jgi:hypothetical protein
MIPAIPREFFTEKLSSSVTVQPEVQGMRKIAVIVVDFC